MGTNSRTSPHPPGTGRGTPPAALVLTHGAGSGPWVYDGWAESLLGLRVLAVDLQHGLDVSRASHDDYARTVAEAAASLPAPVALGGWSMGGLVVLQAAAWVQPHSVIVLDSSPPAEVQGRHPATEVVEGSFDPEAVYGSDERRFPGLDHWDIVRMPQPRAAVADWLGVGGS